MEMNEVIEAKTYLDMGLISEKDYATIEKAFLREHPEVVERAKFIAQKADRIEKENDPDRLANFGFK